MRRPRPEIEARRSGLCQTPGESVQLLQFSKKKHVLNFHPVSTDLITGELWNHGNGRALAFPLLPGFQRKLVLLKLVAPGISQIGDCICFPVVCPVNGIIFG